MNLDSTFLFVDDKNLESVKIFASINKWWNVSIKFFPYCENAQHMIAKKIDKHQISNVK